jgi:PIN domain nuclease of toxin-antitoxin system
VIGLLDTHVFLWWATEPSKLSAAALTFLQNPANPLLLSVASVWEAQIKHQLGKLKLQSPLATLVAQQQQTNGIALLPIDLDHVFALSSLPKLHKDPFDRILIAQANTEGATLLSADPIIAQYPVQALW